MLNEERDRWLPLITGHGPTDELKIDPRKAAILTGKQWKTHFTELKKEFTIANSMFTRSGQNETTRTDTPEHNNEDEAEDDADDWNLQPESSNEDEALIRGLENMRRRGKNPVHHRIG